MAEGLLNPQQELFLASYTNPKSDTFANAYQSAKKAGYAEEYAQNITNLMPNWLSENMGDLRRLQKAERNMEEVQDLDIKDPTTGKADSALVQARTKVDIFIAERLSKGKYANRTELTGKNGEAMEVKAITGMKIISQTNGDRVQDQEQQTA